jgi:hypothetical protein
LNLQRLEDAAFQSGDAEKGAQLKLDRALAEIERDYGADPHRVSVSQLSRLASDVSGVATTPTSPKAWTQLILGLPAEMATSWLAQRTLVQTHRLRPELQGSGQLRSMVKSLFDPVY